RRHTRFSRDWSSDVCSNDVIEDISDATQIDELGRKSSFMTLTVTTINENLSTIWANTLLETVDEFYAEIQTTKTRKTLSLDRKSTRLNSSHVKISHAVF